MIDYLKMDYEEFDKYMEEKYPDLFAGYYGGFAIGAGWRHIVDRLCSNVVQQIKWRNIEDFKVEQVKEKLGGLRFYVSKGDPAIGGLIAMAEEWAENTCEVCGEKGKERGGNWIRTLCEKHYREQEESKV
jgi:hypothetical protein